eukprot:4528020-Heterocapsa_arctica.AAC.1
MPSFAFLGYGSKAYPGRGGEGSQPPARGFLWMRNLRFFHGGHEKNVQEPVGQRASCRNSVEWANPGSQSTCPSDSPGS